MTEERTDWKVAATLDRDKLEKDITTLLGIMKRQRVYCIVSADCEERAKMEAIHHMEVHLGIPPEYVKALHTRRMPT